MTTNREMLITALRIAADSYDQDASRMRWYPNAQERIAESSGQAVEARMLADAIERGDTIQLEGGKPVKVIIEGGIVAYVEGPAGMTVHVYDYDTEGADLADLKKDDKGVRCWIREFECESAA